MLIQGLPSGYHFDEKGLTKGNEGNIIANFYLKPVTAYCRADESLPSFCDISVVQGERCIPFKSRVPLSELTRAWWKTPPPGCCYEPGARAPYRHMEALFQTLLGSIEPVTIYQPDTLGWNILPTGEHIYVTGGAAIGADGYISEDRIWVSGELGRYQLETLPSASEKDASQYFWYLYRMMPGITDILLANAFAAILFPCFKEAGVESRFPIILEGPSEAKKTTLARLTGCLYNRKSNLRSCVATLTSTNRALEKRGIELRHTVVVFDDLFPDGGNALEQKALELIRNIANQIPRQARSGKLLEGSTMECGAVITAEAFPNCERSTRTRCLRLVLSKPVPNHLLLPFQEQPELLGNVFQSFIRRTAKKFEETAQQIAEDFQRYREQRAKPGADPVSSERLYEIGFVLYTALKVFLSQEYGQNSSKTEETLRIFQDYLNGWIGWQLSSQAVPGRGRLISTTAGLVKQWPQKFFRRSGYVCIPPRHLCSLLQQCSGDRTISVPDIISQLRSEGFLSIDKSGAATKKVKGLGRCLCINEQKLLR